jgi:hypothetical protein
MSLIKVMQALVNLQADTCERCVDVMVPSHAKMNVVAYRSRLTLVKLKLQREMEKLRRGAARKGTLSDIDDVCANGLRAE